MAIDLAIRFAFGGALVTLFALIGEVTKPKSFAGIFGAAPSVAIASLVLAFLHHGPTYVAVETRSMVLGAIALATYGVLSMSIVSRPKVTPWIAALLLWAEWLGVALAAWAVTLR